MKKSQIVVAVVQKKSVIPVTEKEILKGLSEHLSNYSLNIEKWNEDVEERLAKAVIKNIGSMKADVPMRFMIREVDIILRRVMS
jgi:hypothetical protein